MAEGQRMPTDKRMSNDVYPFIRSYPLLYFTLIHTILSHRRRLEAGGSMTARILAYLIILTVILSPTAPLVVASGQQVPSARAAQADPVAPPVP